MTDVFTPRRHGGGGITWVGWAASLSFHLATILASIAFLQHLRLSPASERFRWDVAMVETNRPAAEMPSSPVPNSTPALTSTATAPQFESPPPHDLPVDAPPSTEQAPSTVQSANSRPPLVTEPSGQVGITSPPAIAPPVPPIAASPSDTLPFTATESTHQSEPREPTADPTPVPTSQTAPAISSDNAQPSTASTPSPSQQVSSVPVTPAASPRQDLNWLTDLLLQRVNAVKRYPPEARLEQVQGKVVVKVVVREDGSVTDVEITKSSGSSSLDQAAMEAMRQAGPLSLPRPLGKPRLTIRIPISYSLARS